MATVGRVSPSETKPGWVPKLAVRSRTSTPDGELAALPVLNRGASPPVSRPASNRTTTPTIPRRRSEHSHHSQESLERLRRSSQAESQAPSRTQDGKKAKKRGAGVLGFLTLKEPSSAAWAQYAEAQKKAAAQTPGRSKADVLPGVSSQKLPDFVPKTNSKWDGLPDSPKQSSMQTKGSSKRLSTTSSATKQTSRSTLSGFSDGSGDSGSRKRYGSISSKPAKPESAPQAPSKRMSVQSQQSTVGSVNGVARPLTATTDRSGVRGYSAVTPWNEPVVDGGRDRQSGSDQTTFLLPPTPPPMICEATLEPALPELDASESQQAQYQTSPDQSPQTPPVNFGCSEHGPSVADPLFSPQSVSEMGRLWTFWHSDTDTDAEVPRAVSPSVKNFSRPIQRQQYGIAVQPHAPIAIIVESEDDGTETDGGREAAEESDYSTPRHERPDAFSGDGDTALACDASTLDGEEKATSKGMLKVVAEDDDLKMVVSLRDAEGRTSPFIFERERIAPLDLAPSVAGNAGLSLNRVISNASRTTAATDATDFTVNAPLQSPTFSASNQDSTRPSTPGSTVSIATAQRRPSLMSIQSQANSLAPSDISEQWGLSPKQRLGLGGMVVRKEETGIMPWEVDEDVSTGRSVSRASMLSGVDGSKLKRLSLRLGRK